MMKKSRKIICLSILLFNFSMVEHVAASTAKVSSNNSKSEFSIDQLNEIKAGVERGEKQAFYEYAYYLHIVLEPADIAQAIDYYKKASALGHRSANHNLGLIYYRGIGVEQDYEEAAKWLMIASDRGLNDSREILVSLYLRDLIPQNSEKLIPLLEKLIENGHEEYKLKLANYYYFREKNYKKAEPIYLALAEQGETEVYFNLGSIYFKGLDGKPDYTKAFPWFKKNAELGNSRDQLFLGILLLYGLGVQANTDLALVWFQASADQGNKEAQKYLQELVFNDSDDMPQFYQSNIKEAEKGNAFAQYNIGLIFQYGLGIEENQQKAFEWYSKAADQGNGMAQLNLANMYINETCECTPFNIEKVIQLYKQSASQNIAQAQFNLGQIYSSELFGYLDLDEANKWYKIEEEKN